MPNPKPIRYGKLTTILLTILATPFLLLLLIALSTYVLARDLWEALWSGPTVADLLGTVDEDQRDKVW